MTRPLIRTNTRSGSARSGTAVAAALLALTGVLFALYPAVRPYRDGGGEDGTAELASGWWVVAHLCAVVGFITFALALQALRTVLRGTAGDRPMLIAGVVTWLGVGLTLPYYGAETFALHALGVRGTTDSGLAVLALTEDIRMGSPQVAMFGAGLLLLGIGAVFAAVALARSMPRRVGLPMALGFATFIPQFFLAAGLRMAHGALIAIGCLWIAVELLRNRPAYSARSTTTGA